MRIIALLLLSLIIFFPLSGCEAQRQRPEDTVIRIKGQKEILVARDIDRGGEGFYTLKWCGNRGLIFRSQNLGVGLIDFESKEKVKLDQNLYDALLNCSPDGNSFLYIDAESQRSDEEIDKENKIEFLPGVYGWLGSTHDMYVYDITTGKKTLVAGVRSDLEYDALSPDGKKILLGRRHRLAARKGGGWEDVWFSGEQSFGGVKWFPDSTGIVSYGKGSTNVLCVEFFGFDGWVKCFKQKDSVDIFKTDRAGTVYYLEGHPLAPKHFLNQCEIKNRELHCERILEEYDFSRSFDFLPDGDIIFQDYVHDECIRRASPGDETARCVIGLQYGDAVYDGISPVGVSPDGRWFVFQRYNRITRPGEETIYWHFDLFAIELRSK